MKEICNKAKLFWKRYEYLFWAVIYEGMMLYTAYYAVLGRYVYRDRTGSSRFAILSIACGVMAMTFIASFDYRYVFKRKDSGNYEK